MVGGAFEYGQEAAAMSHPRVPFLRKIQLFGNLPATSLNRIAEVSGLQAFAANSYLFHEGDEPDFVYGLVQGSVALLAGQGEHTTVIENFGAGETVLLAAALLGLPYLVSGRAMTSGQCILVPASKLRKLIDEDVALAAQCARVLSRHWRILVMQIKEIKTQSAVQRLARYLVNQAGRSTGSGCLNLGSSKREVAGLLGIAPETLSRTLKKLRPLGVESHGGQVTIASLERLDRLATPPEKSH
jgi:CRP/FNR family transcriptional activator FtrB